MKPAGVNTEAWLQHLQPRDACSLKPFPLTSDLDADGTHRKQEAPHSSSASNRPCDAEIKGLRDGAADCCGQRSNLIDGCDPAANCDKANCGPRRRRREMSFNYSRCDGRDVVCAPLCSSRRSLLHYGDELKLLLVLLLPQEPFCTGRLSCGCVGVRLWVSPSSQRRPRLESGRR